MGADQRRISDVQDEVRSGSRSKRNRDLGAGMAGRLADFGIVGVQRGYPGITEEGTGRVADVAELEIDERVAGRGPSKANAVPDAGVGRRAGDCVVAGL